MEYYTGERTPTLRDSMIGEYYTKLNKSVGKTDISYDLTYKRNHEQNKLMNKIEPQAWERGTDWK